jgi:hypothetical protein
MGRAAWPLESRTRQAHPPPLQRQADAAVDRFAPSPADPERSHAGAPREHERAARSSAPGHRDRATERSHLGAGLVNLHPKPEHLDEACAEQRRMPTVHGREIRSTSCVGGELCAAALRALARRRPASFATGGLLLGRRPTLP